MERPRKRPRLHFLGSVTPEPDEELDVARRRNDNLLKTKWENIFQKYEKDFTGIGDEIGMLSGELEVDNGHVRSLQTEGAAGDVWEVGSGFDGRKMLRAMTNAPSECSDSEPDANEVLQSIETMTDIAMLDDFSSEDDLFDEEVREQSSELDSIYDHDLQPTHETEGRSAGWASATPERSRSKSPDSLFDAESEVEKHELDESSKTSMDTETPPLDQGHPQIYKSTIRDEVRRIMEEERAQWSGIEDDEVDPTWRIPVQMQSALRDNLRTELADTSMRTIDAMADTLPEPDNSIWAAPTRFRRTKREVAAERNMRRIRAESEDPLQEGFSSDAEVQDCHSSISLEGRLGRANTTQNSFGRARYAPSDELAQSCNDVRDSEDENYVEADETLHLGDENTSDDDHEVITDQRVNEYHENYGNDHNFSGTDGYKFSYGDDEYLDGAEEDRDEHSKNSHTRRRYVPSPPARMVNRDNLTNDNDRDTITESGNVETSNTPIMPKKPAGQRLPRLSSYETPADRSHHPWQTPFTRSGKPLGRKALRQRENVVARMSERAKTTALDDDLAYDEQFENVDDAVVRELERQRIMKPMERGICYYCKNSHIDKSGVGAHWDRILTNFTLQVLPEDDPHDIPYLHSVRAQVERRIRPPKTIVADFKLYIQLHEGSQVSFDRIVASQLLHTTKNADRVEIEYHQYRQPAQAQPEWTSEETDNLKQMLHKHLVAEGGNKLITMIRLHKDLKMHRKISFVNFGNKLAEVFLEEHASNDKLRDYLVEQLKQPVKSRAEKKATRMSADELLAFPYAAESERTRASVDQISE